MRDSRWRPDDDPFVSQVSQRDRIAFSQKMFPGNGDSQRVVPDHA
ncbi:Uncharacterised protein [Mycobacteroides abscessus subsp. abscessus]|nr:Uncharacterised protein [Mycobacteroides abscessus subsp. abscessus]